MKHIVADCACRGVKFAKMLVNCFSLHVYDNLSAMHSGCKKDPRLSQSTAVEMGTCLIHR